MSKKVPQNGRNNLQEFANEKRIRSQQSYA